ncbi:MAG: transcriptional regulator [Anaerolineales bacterium]|nr:transcriptional regulator [Anaerolineales bacterium]
MSSPEDRKVALPSIDDIDRIIHSPARLIILSYLEVVEEMDFIYLMNLTELTWGNLSVHLRKLEEAGYLRISKSIVQRKTRTTLQITGSGKQALQKYREQMRTILQK